MRDKFEESPKHKDVPLLPTGIASRLSRSFFKMKTFAMTGLFCDDAGYVLKKP